MKYFGTDGIRGKFGGDVLNEAFVRRLGYAVSRFMIKHNRAKPVTVVVGRDTRASGIKIEQLLYEGICKTGLHVVRLGIVPTPAISMSVRDLHADLGIAITASHNPATDNGIKLFDNRGMKFSPEAEIEIEAFIDAEPEHPENTKVDCGYDHDAPGYYANYMRSLLHQNCLNGWKIVLDTANGASCETSLPVFQHFGAEIVSIGNQPDGQNINDHVGSEHPELLAETVLKSGAKIGIAHDGDADRVVFCDELGSILTGEEVMGAIGLDLFDQGQLDKNAVVTTIQSNLGLDAAFAKKGIKTLRVDIGDRNVLMALREHQLSFGGESSGHYIFFKHSVAGDGLMMAIQMVSLMLRSKKPLSELRKVIKLFPQKTQNVRVKDKRPLAECPAIQETMKQVTEALGESGRILVRYSGTEPKLRLLVEAESDSLTTQVMEQLATAVKQDLEVVS